MKSISIRIDTTNSAFGEVWEMEVARILNDLAYAIENGVMPDCKYDANGNKVCFVEYKE